MWTLPDLQTPKSELKNDVATLASFLTNFEVFRIETKHDFRAYD